LWTLGYVGGTPGQSGAHTSAAPAAAASQPTTAPTAARRRRSNGGDVWQVRGGTQPRGQHIYEKGLSNLIPVGYYSSTLVRGSGAGVAGFNDAW
jgi:hypothetical protein